MRITEEQLQLLGKPVDVAAESVKMWPMGGQVRGSERRSFRGRAGPARASATPARSPDHESTFAQQCQVRSLAPLCLPQPQRQYRFATELRRDFRADFAWPPQKLIVEIQGGIWMQGGGAHSRPGAIERDIERCQYMARLGWWYLPLTEKDLSSSAGIDLVMQVLERLGWHPGA